MNIVEFLSAQAEQTPYAPALKYDVDREVSFTKLLSLVRRAAGLLSKHEPGSHVGLLMKDSVLQVVMRVAAMQVGVIAVPLTNRVPPPELAKRANLFSLTVIYTDGEYVEHTNAIGKDVVRVDDVEVLPTLELTAYQGHGDDRICVAWSGGTYGTPDALYYSHNSLKAMADSIELHIFGEPNKEVLYPVVPQMSGAWIMHLVLVMVHGHSLVLEAQPFSPALIANNIINHKVSYLMGTSPVYKTLLRKDNLPKSHLPKKCLAAGDAVSMQIQREWQAHYHSKLTVCFASTQTGPFSTQKPNNPLTSVGEGWSGFEVKLLNDQGNTVADGEPGQLWIRTKGGAVADVTANGTTSFGEDGWRTTNDMMIHKDGVYYMVGRKTDTFKVNGQFVGVLKVEDLVRDIPGVIDAVAAPDFDHAGLPRVKVYVVTEQGLAEQNQIAQAVLHLHEDLYGHERPRLVEFINEIPRHPGSMKLQRMKLNPLYKQLFNG